MAAKSKHLLILEARFYDELADELANGAIAEIKQAGATYEKISVPGAFELPTALAMVCTAMDQGRVHYDGFVILGCVIRGETSHYDIVAEQSARGVLDLAMARGLALGNGIITVDEEGQAWVRARTTGRNKGGGAAASALAMIALRERFGLAE